MTETAIALRAVVSEIAPTLSAAGFRKRANAFNRVNDDGVVHVVSFQAGAYEFGHVSPLIGESLHGRFTLNVGVWVPRLVNAAGRPTPTGPWVSEAYCQLRWRIGQFADEPRDIWWSTGDPDAADEVRALLTERALPRLAMFASETDLLDLWEGERRSDFPDDWRSLTLDFAGLYAARGDREAERRLLSAHVDRLLADPPDTHHHPAYFVELLESVGYPELAEPLRPLTVPRVDG